MSNGKFAKNRKSFRIAALILIAVSLFALIGGIVAKYVTEKRGENLLSAKVFYFGSNLLKEGGAEYTFGSDTESISFTLGNNADKLRFADDDVTYTVSVSHDAGIAPSVSSGSGTLAGGTLSTATVTLSGLEKGKSYTVTAVGTAGYEKTISATFVISDDEQNLYKHLDASSDYFVVLTVWSKNVTGELSVSLPDACEGLIPDSTDPILSGIYNFDGSSYKAFSFNDNESFVENYSSRTYRFFIDSGKTAADFDVEKFTVILSNGATKFVATPATP